MPDDNTPGSTPENAYPPPASAYPPPADPPPANPYGTPATPPPNPYGTPSTPPSNPYSQGQTNPPPSGYGTPPPQSNWQPPPPAGAYGVAPSPVNGQNIMIMGIVSIFCFGIILGPIAWVMGNNALKTLDQYGDPMNQRSSVSTGRICGIVGTILAALGIIGYIVSMVVGLAASGMHSS